MEHYNPIFSKVPTLRFKKYDTNWNRKRLSDYVKKITQKNSNNIIKNVICNSAQNGLIPQLDFFDKEIANDENTVGYYIINNGDFVYNPRKSLNAPYGPVNMYKYEKAGIVSPLYLCFSVDESINKSFLLQRFKSPCWYRYIYLNGDSGARHDRVSIKDDVFLSQPISLPSAEEQTDIAVFLEKIDERIEIQNKIISKYETLIKGLCDMIFRHDKSASLSDLVKCKTSALQENMVSTCPRGEYKVLGASGAIAVIDTYQFDESGILVLKDGSKAGKIQFAQGKYSVIGTSVVLIPNEACDARYLYFAMSSIDFEKYKVGSGIPHIYFKDYSNERIYYPDKALRKKITKTLDFYETMVEIERKMLSAMQKQKAFLLQSMFI